jgi:hypothetical protein
MNPIRTDTCNTVLRGGHPDVQDLYIERGESPWTGPDGQEGVVPHLFSYWRPSVEELKCLNEGGVVRFFIQGMSHAPLWLDATKVTEVVYDGLQHPVR